MAIPWVREDIFFLIDTDGSRRSRVNEVQSAEEKNIIIIIIFFSSALCASLRRLRREPSVSIRKKYPLEPRVA